MHVILVPGFWLDARSWDGVVPTLEAAGLVAHPMTLPGLSSLSDDRRQIRLRDHVDAVIALIDALDVPVVLVGHSGGGPIVHAAADARIGRVERVVHVDTFPLADGLSINKDLPAANGEIPLPAWEDFEDEDLVDLDDTLRAMFRSRAIPQPAAVASDAQRLLDPRRHDISTTVIACEFTSEQLRSWMDGGATALSELAQMRDVEYIDLPTGHWPQFTRPVDLGEAIAAAVLGTNR